jgi:hypothetical protein
MYATLIVVPSGRLRETLLMYRSDDGDDSDSDDFDEVSHDRFAVCRTQRSDLVQKCSDQ